MVSISVTSDFNGKVLGSTVENPNIVKRGSSSTLQPTTGGLVEGIQTTYDNLKVLDGTLSTNSSSTTNNMYQYMFSFDVIQILERKLGYDIWNGKTLLSDKIAIAKIIISTIQIEWYGYGTSPTGNKATLSHWSTSNSTWIYDSVYHTNATVTRLSIVEKRDVSTGWAINTINNIDSNGFVHFLVNAEASDGVTPSVINTDYVLLTITSDFQNTNTASPSRKKRKNFRNQDTIKTHDNVTIASANGGYGSSGNFVSCDGYETLALSLLNDASTNSTISVDWSNDGTIANIANEVLVADTKNVKSGITTVKGSYFRVFIWNSDTVSHVFNAYAYLKS